MRSHPGVEDAAVYALPSAEWGESVAALVVADGEGDLEEELQAFVRERLRSSRVPERIDFVTQLPYNEMGKLQRNKLSALLQGLSSKV